MSVDLLCFSHLRWAFVTQRPNHLMARAARDRRVFFVEEPILDEEPSPQDPLEITRVDDVFVVRPHLPAQLPPERWEAALTERLDLLVSRFGIRRPVRWYYTPMALPWSEHIPASAVVYDCMDELTAFTGAPPVLVAREQRLLDVADVVFTGGQSLYGAKRERHPHVHAFPSSVDADHFREARRPGPEPADQAWLPGPRIGWFGVIDERFDMPLVEALADRRPDWQLVMVGPFAKIDEASVPRRANLHWLGQRPYAELPAYLRGWDVAVMPFARNEATRYISPTKTPEYLAAGRPVVSTPITDVVTPYGRLGLVRIAADAAAFEAAVNAALHDDRAALWRKADAYLATTSWDATWAKMSAILDQLTLPVPSLERRRAATHVPLAMPPLAAGHGTAMGRGTRAATLAPGGASGVRGLKR